MDTTDQAIEQTAMLSVASSRIRIDPADPWQQLNYQPRMSGSAMFVAASD